MEGGADLGVRVKIKYWWPAKFYQEKNKDIIAYIKYNNLASKKAFEKAGFQLEGNEDIKGIKSYKYKYEIYEDLLQ